MQATTIAPVKFDRRAIAQRAWALAKGAQKAHRNLRKAAEFLGYGMKTAWAEAKAVAAKPAVEKQVTVIKVGYGNAEMPASYKQYNYLNDLANCLSLAGLNSSQFCKRVNSFEASEAIGLAKAGRKVEFVLA